MAPFGFRIATPPIAICKSRCLTPSPNRVDGHCQQEESNRWKPGGLSIARTQMLWPIFRQMAKGLNWERNNASRRGREGKHEPPKYAPNPKTIFETLDFLREHREWPAAYWVVLPVMWESMKNSELYEFEQFHLNESCARKSTNRESTIFRVRRETTESLILRPCSTCAPK